MARQKAVRIRKGKDVVVRQGNGGIVYIAIPPDWLAFREQIHNEAALLAVKTGRDVVGMYGDMTSLFVKIGNDLFEFRVDREADGSISRFFQPNEN